jgi:hypothetical protein
MSSDKLCSFCRGRCNISVGGGIASALCKPFDRLPSVFNEI